MFHVEHFVGSKIGDVIFDKKYKIVYNNNIFKKIVV